MTTLNPTAMTDLAENATATRTLLGAAELWRPNDSGQLRRDTGLYGPHDALRDSAQDLTLDPGQGLAGAAFADGRPRVFSTLDNATTPERVQAAHLGDLRAAAALPRFHGGKITSVLVLFFRGDDEACGAVELWSAGPGLFELALGDCYHAGQSLERFARISRYVNFPQGAGLPGRVWEQTRPEIVPDVSAAKGFLRTSGDGGRELSVGLGIPLMSGVKLQAVLLLLSARRAPIARVHEIWEADANDATRIVRRHGVYGELKAFGAASDNLSFAITGDGEGLPGRVWQSAEPLLIDNLDDLGAARREAAREARLTCGLAIPTVVADSVRYVTLLMW